MPDPRGRIVALLGTESTGKTTLSHALALSLRAAGRDAVVVAEYLREFCDREGRTPAAAEQWPIAREQARRSTRLAVTRLYISWVTMALHALAPFCGWMNGVLRAFSDRRRPTGSIFVLRQMDNGSPSRFAKARGQTYGSTNGGATP